MGLCKCPKRKVTNLFCYEHRVNVCEFCLVDNHPNCVVQSYLAWLTDSDYDPNCALCQTPLNSGETIRLNCLHLLHWKCFDDWAAAFPNTTAPAGYRCPCCSKEVFPPLNEVSPLVEKLREQLKLSNWARAALGLPVLPELNRPITKTFDKPIPPPIVNKPVENVGAVAHQTQRSITPATHLDMEDSASFSVSSSDVTFSRKKNLGDTRPLLQNDNRDADNEANKYKRRPAGEWIRGLWRAKYGPGVPEDGLSGRKKLVFVVFIAFVSLVTIYLVLKRLGVNNDNDPMFDPLSNPNIRVASNNE
ncbi:unnamed protein product [Caenorhabditis angaria]|uniref:Zinc finger protein-like 1 homolog n=1 Tax=Caenorhabditis angaria TaxID=860376 RepID=A0A9P1IW92_9PELO|nr:unnamed protein product [Caenorhabditis angaria]